MEAALSVLVGLFFTAGIYLLLSQSIIRMLLGLVLFGNAVNLLIFTAGRVTREMGAIIPAGSHTLPETAANALPQALILTAIVISFSLFAFVLVLALRAYQEMGTDDVALMRVAEPENASLPPMGY